MLKAILRLFFCLWYLFFIGGALEMRLLLAHFSHQPQLSDVCAEHTCACTHRGYCEATCCCAPQEEESTSEADDPELVSCGDGGELLVGIDGVRQHLAVLDLQFAFLGSPQLLPSQRSAKQAWRTLDPPQKVPIHISG